MQNEIGLFLFFRLDGADHGELAVAQVADVILDVHHHRRFHGVALELHTEQRKVVAHVAAGFIVARHPENLFEHEDLMAFTRKEVVADAASVLGDCQHAVHQLLDQHAEGTAFVVEALLFGLELGAVVGHVSRDLYFFFNFFHGLMF